MARIHFRISSALARWRARGHASPRRFRMMDLQALRELTLGPGWFDSSWDLGHGLEVAVGLPGDPTFLAWLEAQARAFESVAGKPAQPVPVENMLEFEPVDWKAWAAPELSVDLLPKCDSAGPDLPGLKLELEMPELEFEPELELELV
jgi:hypothetical protein